MSDIELLFVYIPLALSNLAVLLIALKRDRKKRMTQNILFFGSMLLGWSVMLIIFNLTKSRVLSFYFYDLDMPFVAFSSLAMLLLVLRFFNLDSYYNPVMIALLSIIPAFTTAFSVTPFRQNFLRQSLLVVSTFPYHEVVSTRGLWFWVHAIYGYLLAIIAFGIAIYQVKKVPPVYRSASRTLIIGMAITLLGNIITISGISSLRLDFSLVGASITLIFIYISIRNNQGLDFLSKAKEEVFNDLDEAIFILDDGYNITEKNLEAHTFIRTIKLDPSITSFSVLLRHIEGNMIQVNSEDDLEERDYSFSLPEGTVIYNLKEKAILDQRNRQIGFMMSFTDVTENRTAIQKLEDIAGIDALTGLLNRGKMESITAKIDSASALPLTTIVGDINNLKLINDTFGHRQGDILLRSTADAFISCVPPRASIARIGGDEFLILIPNFSLSEADQLIADILDFLQNQSSVFLRPSISLGAATKTATEQELSDIINIADERMYRMKTVSKKRNVKSFY